MSPLVSTLASASVRGYGGLSVAPVVETNAFESIATQTADGLSGTITFSNIPQTYAHLQLRGYAAANGATQLDARFNNISTSSYSHHVLGQYGAGTFGEGEGARNTMIFEALTSDTNVFTAYVIDILDYANTTRNKTTRGMQGFSNDGSVRGSIASNAFYSTAAITRIDLIARSANFRSGSVFALYGIKGA